jgi:hypothetical protein
MHTSSTMPRRTRYVAAFAAGASAVGLVALTAPAQATSRIGTVSVVASHLDNPRGLAFGPDDVLYIAEAGHGGPLCIGQGPDGSPSCAGLTGGVSRLDNGVLTRVVDHIISLASPAGIAAEGMAAVSTWGSHTYAQIGANTAGIPPQAPASNPIVAGARAQLGRTIAITATGWRSLASTGDINFAWTATHKALQPDQFPDSNPNGITTVGTTQYVANAGANLLAGVNSVGGVSPLAYFRVPAGSPTDAVPTCVAQAPDGSLYVGELLGGTFAPGHARVWRIANGHAAVKWDGFTTIQGCGFDDLGNFYATEFQASGLNLAPNASPLGAVVKVTPSGHRTTFGMGSLFFPSGFAYNDGAVYVSNWSIMPAQNQGPTGQVVKIVVH